jgi:5'-nucleotidase
LTTLNEYNVPVIIISAGLGDFVKLVLESNNALFPNIFLVSNMLKFNGNDEAVGLEETIIHPFNKDEKELPIDMKMLIENRPNVMLLGDTLDDIRMANLSPKQTVLSFGFLDEGIEQNLSYFKDAYDVVLKQEQAMDIPNTILKEVIGE